MPAVTPPFTLAPGASATVTVRFTPSVAGARTGSLSIVSNDPGSPDSVALSGTGTTGGGTGPTVGLDHTSLTFPDTGV